MNWLRLAGAAALVASGALAGEAHYRSCCARLEALRQVCAFLQRLQQEIDCRRSALPQLYGQLCAEAAQQPGELLFGCQPPEVACFQQMQPPGVLRPEQRQCFGECVQGMGRAAAVQECRRLAYYARRFAAWLGPARERQRQASLLDRKLGFAAGLAAALLFL